jgi:hypothetical protein
MDRALAENGDREVHFARIKGLSGPLLVALAEDEITGTGATVHRVVLAIEGSPERGVTCFRDWELLLRLNELQASSEPASGPSTEEIRVLNFAIGTLITMASHLALPFRRSRFTPVMAMLPEDLNVRV